MRGGYLFVIGTCAMLALAPASQASVTRLDGTVIKRARDAHSFVLVTRTGRMLGFQARRSPTVGRVTRLGARRLRSGRWSARRIRILGRRQAVRVRGAVRSVNAQRHVFRLSTRGASVLVHVRGNKSLPLRGSRADLRASIDRQGWLWLTSLPTNATGAKPGGTGPAGGSSTSGSSGRVTRPGESGAVSGGSSSQTRKNGFSFMDGVLAAVDPQAHTFRVAPEQDDDPANEDAEPALDADPSAGSRRYGNPVTLSVSRSIDMARFQAGQKVRLVLQEDAAGKLVVQDADVSGRDDDNTPDPDDGPADDTGPDPAS
jgi:hypothetical protein